MPDPSLRRHRPAIASPPSCSWSRRRFVRARRRVASWSASRGAASRCSTATRCTVSLQLSPEDVGPLPPGIRVNGWPDVTVDVADPTTEQMLLRSALDLGPLLLFLAGAVAAAGLPALGASPATRSAPRTCSACAGIGFLLVARGAASSCCSTRRCGPRSFNTLPPYPSLDLGLRGAVDPARRARWAGSAPSSSPRSSPTGCGCARTSRRPSDVPVVVHLDRLLEERGMTLTELAQRVDITVVNLSILKNGRARAVRFSTLAALVRGARLPARRPARLRGLRVRPAPGGEAPRPTPAAPRRPRRARSRCSRCPSAPCWSAGIDVHLEPGREPGEAEQPGEHRARPHRAGGRRGRPRRRGSRPRSASTETSVAPSCGLTRPSSSEVRPPPPPSPRRRSAWSRLTACRKSRPARSAAT